MISKQVKQGIVQLIVQEEVRFGSANKLAQHCKVSPGVISFCKNGIWQNVSEEMWLLIGNKLRYPFDDWNFAETTTSAMMKQVLKDAKDRLLFMAVSYRAGVGKSAACKQSTSENTEGNQFYIQCREWSKREFLEQLCTALGVKAERKGYVSTDNLLMLVAEFFQQRIGKKPLLIIDEADKLKHSALRTLITLYNECQDKMGCVMVGTDNLEVEVKRGVRYNRKGFDEIDSRFGRRFIHLHGSTYEDVKKICVLNGVSVEADIKRIFESAEPVLKPLADGNFVKFVNDLRRVRRAVVAQLLKQSTS